MKKNISYLLAFGLQILSLSTFAGSAPAMRRISHAMKDSTTTATEMVALLDEAAQAGHEQWITANLGTFITRLNKENSEQLLTSRELQDIKSAAIRAVKKVKRRKKILLDYLLAHFAPLKTNQKPRTFVVADIEGNWKKVETFIEKCDAIFFDNPDDPTAYKATIIDPNTQLVFLGDSIDKGSDSIKVLRFLIHLKKKYKDQVTLIMGNRDINKIRFHALSELTNDALDLSPNSPNKVSPSKFRLSGWEKLFNEWIEGKLNTKTGQIQPLRLVDGVPAMYTHGLLPDIDKILKLKFLMQETLGAGMTFDRNTGEITSSQNAFDDFKKEINAQTDLETFNKYMEFVGPTGLVMEYLQLAEMIHFDQNTGTLFMHGGISDENFGYIPATKKDGADNLTIENILQWTKALNRWAHDRIRDGLQKNVAGVLPLIEYQEPAIKIENGLEFWDGNKPNPYSVVQVRPWGPDKNLAPLDKTLIEKLLKQGVTKIVFGHSPVGEVPVIVKGEKEFISVAADTSYTRAPHPRNAAIEITKDEVTVYADYYEKLTDQASGETTEIKNELIYSSKDPNVGISTVIDGKTYWNISPIHNEEDMLQGTWSAPTVSYQVAPAA